MIGAFLETQMIPSGKVIGISLRNASGIIDINSKKYLTTVVREGIIPAFEKNFAVGGRPPWKPLAESTLIRKRYKRKDRGILQESGNLKYASTRLARWKISREIAEWSLDNSKVKNYGYYHISGTRNMPKRDYTEFTDKDIDAAVELLGDGIMVDLDKSLW